MRPVRPTAIPARQSTHRAARMRCLGAWLLLASACVGGQSGDPGTGFDDDFRGGKTAQAAFAPRCTAPSMNTDTNADDDAGVPACDAVDGGGWDCLCEGGTRDSDAASCEDALHEQCGVPLPEPPAEPKCVEIEGGPAECRAQDPDGP